MTDVSVEAQIAANKAAGKVVHIRIVRFSRTVSVKVVDVVGVVVLMQYCLFTVLEGWSFIKI